MAKRKLLLSTAVWGPWHTGVYLGVNLPSLLAPGNLAALVGRHDVVYRIYTANADMDRIKASPAFRRAQQIAHMEVTGIAIDPSVDPIMMHHVLWRRSIDDALKTGAMILLVPPDVVWSNGALGHVADLAASGKRAIFTTYVRVVAETVVPELQRLVAQEGHAIDVPARKLVELAMRHVHPLFLTYHRDSRNFPVHPELILWPVGGEGYLMRVLVREMFAYDPDFIHLNRQALPAHPIDADKVHYITDSDDLFALSLAPMIKDLEWYATPRRLDVREIGSWWLRYDSPANDAVAARYFCIHTKDRTAATWRRAERQSDALIARVMGTREILRISSAAPAANQHHVQHVLAMALAETKLAHLANPRGRVSFLLPDAASTYQALFERADLMSVAASRRWLMDALLDHVVLGELRLEPGRGQALTTPLGGRRRLEWHGEIPLIDGVALKDPPFRLGRHAAHAVAGVLPPSRRRSETVSQVAVA
jgi:hypothetical protein